MSNFLNRYKRIQSSRDYQPQQKEVALKQHAVATILTPFRATSSRTIIGGPSRVTSSFNAKKDNFTQLPQTFAASNPASNTPTIPKGDFNELVAFCKTQVDFNDTNNMSSTRPKKLSALTKILSSVTNPYFVRQLEFEELESLFEMISINVIRFVPPPPYNVIYADSKVPYTTPGWQHLSIIHQIFYHFVTNADNQYVTKKLTKDFVSSYAQLLESQDSTEQNMVENIITLIFDSVPGYRQMVFNIMLKLLIKYKDNNFYYPAVAPALRFFSHFLKTLNLPIKPQYFHLFQNVIFPLISTQFSFEFFSQLCSVAVFFEEKDKQVARWVLSYLLNHWPKTDSNKQASFLMHLVQVSAYLPVTCIGQVVVSVFNIINDCLLSPNYKVSLAALGVLQNPTFIFTFSGFSEILIPLVFSGINSCSKHWNADVVKASAEVARSMFALNSQVSNKLAHDPVIPQKINDIQSATKWYTLAKSIDENERPIAIGEFKLLVENNFNVR